MSLYNILSSRPEPEIPPRNLRRSGGTWCSRRWLTAAPDRARLPRSGEPAHPASARREGRELALHFLRLAIRTLHTPVRITHPPQQLKPLTAALTLILVQRHSLPLDNKCNRPWIVTPCRVRLSSAAAELARRLFGARRTWHGFPTSSRPGWPYTPPRATSRYPRRFLSQRPATGVPFPLSPLN